MSMHRELNPQLFGNQTPVEKMGQTVDPSKPAAGIMGKAAGAQDRVPYPSIDIKGLEHQISTVKVALMQMEKKTDALNAKVEDLGRGIHQRLERFSQAILRLEEVQATHHQEATGKFGQMAAKVNERKVSDGKIQELIDRHNTIIRNFENRLMSLQRIVTEQEMTLHNAQSALEETRAELVRRAAKHN